MLTMLAGGWVKVRRTATEEENGPLMGEGCSAACGSALTSARPRHGSALSAITSHFRRCVKSTSQPTIRFRISLPMVMVFN